MVQVLQVLPETDFRVYCYFSDGRVKLYDARGLIQGGGVFSPLADPELFKDSCTVMNGTLAWDIGGSRDPYACLDLDPDTLYEESVEVRDPLSRSA